MEVALPVLWPEGLALELGSCVKMLVGRTESDDSVSGPRLFAIALSITEDRLALGMVSGAMGALWAAHCWVSSS